MIVIQQRSVNGLMKFWRKHHFYMSQRLQETFALFAQIATPRRIVLGSEGRRENQAVISRMQLTEICG